MNEDTPKLHVIPHDGQIYELRLDKPEICIGRKKDCDIIFADPRVSRVHAKITIEEDGYVLTDEGSFNGTRLNKNLIQTSLLRHNDKIEIGSNKIIFLTQDETVQYPSDKVVITDEGDYRKWKMQSIKVSPEECSHLFTQTIFPKARADKQTMPATVKAGDAPQKEHAEDRKNISNLERMNKVLFILYEISRQLTSIHDFNELLSKIMDNIFLVIDADFGFLILTEGDGGKDLVPVVVKFKDDKTKAILGEIKASRTLISKSIQDKVALLTTNAMEDSRFLQAESIITQKIRSAMCVPLWKKDEIIGVIQLDSTRKDNQFTEDDLELLKAIGCQMSMVLEQASLNEKIRHEEMLRTRLERFHSPQVIDVIIQSGQDSQEDLMEAKDKNATILFTDIIGFTRLSEKMSPREVNQLLNQYFARMTDIIFEHEGTLDKYLGDGVMAVFGAPMEKRDDAERAIHAALRMRHEVEQLKQEEILNSEFNIRIGINTGTVVAGNIGSPKRLEYTVIGDPVNIASRLETNAEPNQILIGPDTYELVKEKFEVREVGLQTLKGRDAQVMAYEVLE
jgi:adenylate cyclase